MGVLDGKAAIVTGSARGIGRATAKLLSEHGARVLVNDLDRDVAEQTAKEIEVTLTIFRKTSRPSSLSFLPASRRYGAAARRILNGTTVWISSIARNWSSLILCAMPSHV